MVQLGNRERQKLVQAIQAESPEGLVIQHYGNKRKTNRETKIDHMLSDVPGLSERFGRSGVVHGCKRLGELGVGRFLVGRRSHPSRFQWSITPKQLMDQISATDDDDAVRVRSAKRDAIQGDPTQTIQLPVRPDFWIDLPGDLTAAEAERLAGILKSLPFDR